MRMSSTGRRRTVLGLGGALILLVFGYLAWGGLGDSLVYFWTPTELLAEGASAYDTPVRLGGTVSSGSVDWDADTRQLRFQVTDGEETVAVESGSAPPPMFREGIEVVIEGVYTAEGVFRSHGVMVKHSNEYQPPQPGEHPAEAYEQLLQRTESP